MTNGNDSGYMEMRLGFDPERDGDDARHWGVVSPKTNRDEAGPIHLVVQGCPKCLRTADSLRALERLLDGLGFIRVGWVIE